MRTAARRRARSLRRLWLRESQPVFQRVGGRIAWRGNFEFNLIGPDGEQWDEVFVAPNIRRWTHSSKCCAIPSIARRSNIARPRSSRFAADPRSEPAEAGSRVRIVLGQL